MLIIQGEELKPALSIQRFQPGRVYWHNQSVCEVWICPHWKSPLKCPSWKDEGQWLLIWFKAHQHAGCGRCRDTDCSAANLMLPHLISLLWESKRPLWPKATMLSTPLCYTSCPQQQLSQLSDHNQKAPDMLFCHAANHSLTWNCIRTRVSFSLNGIFAAFNQVFYFRAVDIYSANSVNIAVLQQPRLVWSKPELMAIAAYIYCWFSCVILLSAS